MSHGSTREAVERICAHELDDRVLRQRVLEHLRASIDFDWYVWVLTDPRTAVGSSPLADVPDARALPALIAAKYLTPTHRWTSLQPGHVETWSSDRVLRGVDEPWFEHLRAHEVTDAMSLVLQDAYGCWAFLDLWRAGGRFPREDVGLMTALAPPLTRGVRRAVAATFEADAAAAAAGQPPGPGVMLLSDDLVPQARTPAVDPLLRTLLPSQASAAPAPPVPAAALNVGAQLLAREAGVDDAEPSARVHVAGGRWLTVRAARVDPPHDGIAVTFEPTTPADRVDLFARSNGLSRRETEVLRGVLAGARTTELADSMHVSKHTVQDHLKAVFTKTGSRSRPALVARAVGTDP